MKNRKLLKTIIAASLLIISSFTIGVNTSESFATTAKKIPGVSILVKLVSFDTYKLEDEVVNADVNIPAVEEEDFRPMIIEIDYSIKSYNDNRISFAVHYFKSMASSYSKIY